MDIYSSTSNTSNTSSISKIKWNKIKTFGNWPKKSGAFFYGNYTEIFFLFILPSPRCIESIIPFPSLKYKLILPSLPALITIYLKPGKIKLNHRNFFNNYCYDCWNLDKVFLFLWLNPMPKAKWIRKWLKQWKKMLM